MRRSAEIDASLTANLVYEVHPLIRRIVRRKPRVTLQANKSREQNMNGLDLLGEVQVKLLTKLQQEEARGARGIVWRLGITWRWGIAEFKAYAATVVYHCCADYQRSKDRNGRG
jgi:hypothetical protein